MTELLNRASRRAVFAGVAAITATVAAPAFAQQAAPAPGQLPQGWFKACTKQQDVDICNVQNIKLADGGQLITGVSMIEVKGKVNRKIFQISVPSGRMVPPGIGLQVDGGKTTKVDYVICLPDRCIGEANLSDDLVASFKKGQEITLTSVNFQNQPNPIKIALGGFTGAYDGAPLQQADLQDRQKKLQEFVSKNNQDFAKKLKEEQDKAKAAGN